MKINENMKYILQQIIIMVSTSHKYGIRLQTYNLLYISNNCVDVTEYTYCCAGVK